MNASLFPLGQNDTAAPDDSSKGNACAQTRRAHTGHLLCCYCKQIQASMPFFPPHSLSKIAVLCLPLSQLLQTINIHSFLYTSTHRVSICAEVWRSAARVGSVLLELCGVLQQVFIYQFSGCRCPVLLKTSHGIS